MVSRSNTILAVGNSRPAATMKFKYFVIRSAILISRRAGRLTQGGNLLANIRITTLSRQIDMDKFQLGEALILESTLLSTVFQEPYSRLLAGLKLGRLV